MRPMFHNLNFNQEERMNFEIAFYSVVAFIGGFLLGKATPIYIGHDKERYAKAGCGILLRTKTK